MTPLPTLLKKYEALTRDIARLESERAAVHAEILATGRSSTRKPRRAQTRAEAVEVVRDAVRVLREAGEPLPRREVAERLGIKPWAAGYRLDKEPSSRYLLEQ